MEHTSLKSLNINWLIFCFSFAQSPFCHLKTHQFLYNFFNNERRGERKEWRKKTEEFDVQIHHFLRRWKNQQFLKKGGQSVWLGVYSRVLMEGCLETNNTEAANREQKRICFVVANFIASVILTKNRPLFSQCGKKWFSTLCCTFRLISKANLIDDRFKL